MDESRDISKLMAILNAAQQAHEFRKINNIKRFWVDWVEYWIEVKMEQNDEKLMHLAFLNEDVLLYSDDRS